ncbi:hypothetical protein [Deinococcus yavapaiensis]|uniref:Regulation of enolase protein 1 (Concanavalin A-like superfamily) n=1 Tax=Deinococcus yavapaiensis KR-236 TaxID=694435 RepID=A0A318SML9_9DEIO|nr:hypothetical protein [Deinococcus yavapaiensis]PYE53781.1 regulation of enolase protein 1 (concanavalin A-like superfamily) [Deinococcus yavapaiensis KR-236]
MSARSLCRILLAALLSGAVPALAADDLTPLSDEFTDARTLSSWRRADEVEGWPSRWKALDVNATFPGELYVEPQTSEWYADWQAPFLFKLVTGDFVVTTRVLVTGRRGGVPDRAFSLLGLMARAPRSDTAASWSAGHENWLFLTVGTGDGGVSQFEAKTTVRSASTLELTPARPGWVELRLARIGASFVLLHRFEGEAWALHRVFERPDLPATLQVGVNAYTDYDTILKFLQRGAYQPAWANGHVLPDGQPDLRGRVDFVRFQRPIVPTAWRLGGLANVAAQDVLRSLAFPSFAQP